MHNNPFSAIETAAEKRKSMLISEYEKTLKLIEGHPEYKKIKRRQNKITKKTGVEIGRLPQAGLDQLLELLIAAADDITGMHNLQGTHRLVAVELEMDAPIATSERFSDESGLIRVSASVSSMAYHLNVLNSAWLRSYGANVFTAGVRLQRAINKGTDFLLEHPEVNNGAAALRYYLHHLRTWGLSAKVTPRNERPLKGLEGIGALGLRFLVAHEIAHYYLGHPPRTGIPSNHQEAPNLHVYEMEADALAYEILVQNARRTGVKSNEALTVGAILGLLNISIGDNFLFIRPPETHPDFSARWAALQESGARHSSSAIGLFNGLLGMVHKATESPAPLPVSVWENFWNAPNWDTRIHSSGYYKVIQGIDRSMGFAPETLKGLIEDLTTSGSAILVDVIDAIEGNDMQRALTYLRLSNISRLLDAKQPLSHRAFIEEIIKSPVWVDISLHMEGELAKRIIANFVSNAFSAQYRGVANNGR
ncbi:hypothetical protein [Kocuria palustris]|uniref:hypothetical protein n=1 Tax=Kocuria palustris TaxID=71999 RepID=UPI003BF81BB0